VNSKPPKRDLLDRVLVRVPALMGVMTAGIHRMQPGSPLRARLLNLQVKRGFAAMARSDVDVVALAYEPQAEVWMRSMSGVGMSECYQGREGVRILYADLDEVFDDWSWIVREIVDGGDRIAIRGDFAGHGRSSGVKTVLNDGGTALRLSPRGLVAWQEWFIEEDAWERAVGAVGL
jgi:hypothetical protein